TFHLLSTLSFALSPFLEGEPEAHLGGPGLPDDREQIRPAALHRVDRVVRAIEHVEDLGDAVDRHTPLEPNPLLHAEVGSILRRLDVRVARNDRAVRTK